MVDRRQRVRGSPIFRAGVVRATRVVAGSASVAATGRRCIAPGDSCPGARRRGVYAGGSGRGLPRPVGGLSDSPRRTLPGGPLWPYTPAISSRGEQRMASTVPATRESIPSTEYARLEERIVARDQKSASDVLYGLFKEGRPATEILRETVRIHAPYTHVPYHQRLDDGFVKFVNNDHCLLSERVALPLSTMVRPELAGLPL